MEIIMNDLKIIKSISEAKPLEKRGFYAFFVLSESCFRDTVLETVKQGACIYIGKAKDETLYDRISECHLKNTGKSTFRRSLGAILRNKLSLQPIMRGVTVTHSNISNYTFDTESEKKIMGFIYKHLGISYASYSKLIGSFESIEKQLIKGFGYPILNLEFGNNEINNYIIKVKQARKECRDIIANQL